MLYIVISESVNIYRSLSLKTEPIGVLQHNEEFEVKKNVGPWLVLDNRKYVFNGRGKYAKKVS